MKLLLLGAMQQFEKGFPMEGMKIGKAHREDAPWLLFQVDDESGTSNTF